MGFGGRPVTPLPVPPSRVRGWWIVTVSLLPKINWDKRVALLVWYPSAGGVPQAGSTHHWPFWCGSNNQPTTISLKLPASLPVQPTFHVSQIKPVTSSNLMVNFIWYSVFDSVIEISNRRQVLMDNYLNTFNTLEITSVVIFLFMLYTFFRK